MEDKCIVCGETVPEGRHVCPICNREFEERPAQSRKDSKIQICPECGMLEALDAARVMIGKDLSDEAWEKYKRNMMEKFRGRDFHGQNNF